MAQLHGAESASPSPGALAPPLSDSAGPAARHGVTRLGKTVTCYRDDAVKVVIGTRYSSLHPDREWIVVEARLRATSPGTLEIAREEITLLREDGTRLALPSRKEVAEELSNLGRTLITSSAVQDPLDDFSPSWNAMDRIPFVTRTIVDSLVVRSGRVAAGKLLFRAPRGLFRPASYVFEIENRDVSVRIPFRLPAAAWPEGSPST